MMNDVKVQNPIMKVFGSTVFTDKRGYDQAAIRAVSYFYTNLWM